MRSLGLSRFLFGILWGVSILCISCSTESSPLEKLVEAQHQTYPEMQVQDWYKLIHQGAMGNRHLGVEDSLIFNFLLDEWQSIAASDHEPLIEYITPDSTLARMNLRPYKAAGGDPDVLFIAMKSTWDAIVPDQNMLLRHGNQLRQLASKGKLSIPSDDIDNFFQEMKEKGYPAVHHSEVYQATYKPAYRVLHRDYLPLNQ